MPNYANESIPAVRQRLLEEMMSCIDAVPGCDYEQEDVNRCAAILDNYVAKLNSKSNLMEAEIRDTVKQVVLDLNELNENCGHALIETDQREDICEIILASAQNAGLATEEDITQEWRLW